jgi:23S rRNA (guanosine2251-2'-O)-methyltransferase
LKIKKTGLTGKSRSDLEWLYGLNPVLEAIRAGRKINSILISSGRHQKVFEIKKSAEEKNIPVRIVEPDFFNNAFKKGHQGIAAEVVPKGYLPIEELLEIPIRTREIPFFIIFDCIEDPRNFGAVLRVADAAGVHGIVTQLYRSAVLGSEAAKASAGAVEYVPVSLVPNIKHAIYKMKEIGRAHV